MQTTEMTYRQAMGELKTIVERLRDGEDIDVDELVADVGRAKELISQLHWFSIEHVLRGHNQEADRLANAAMDKGMGRRKESAARAPSPALSLFSLAP